MTIKDLRKYSKLNQADFAKRFNLSVRTLQEWEQERCKTPKYVVSMIKEILLRSKTLQNNFFLFRSEVQHQIKRDEKKFILDVINDNDIVIYYEMREYIKCFYLLACLDMLCKKHQYPICSDYDEMRAHKLSEPVYLDKNMSKCHSYLPEFEKYNIYEESIYDVC